MSFIQCCCERGPKSHVAQEKSGRGRRGSREKGNQGVGDFRFVNILQLFLFIFIIILLFFFNYFTLSFFLYFFLPTTFNQTYARSTHSHDQPRPLTMHSPRHLATLPSDNFLSKNSAQIQNLTCWHCRGVKSFIAFNGIFKERFYKKR